VTRRVPTVISTPGNHRPATDHAATFAQAAASSQIVPDTRGRVFNDIRCYNCQSLGHYAQECPTPPHTTNAQAAASVTPTQTAGSTNGTTTGLTTGTTLLQHALVLAQHKHKIDPNWILLDSQN
jgi:Zinc knuckle